MRNVKLILLSAICSALTAPALSADPSQSFTDGEATLIAGRPATIYTSVARAMNTCWFNGTMGLRAQHVFFAKVEPTSRGGSAELGIYSRNTAGKRGRAALVVSIEPRGSESRVTVVNRLFQEAVYAKMRADLLRWARHDLTCGDQAATTATDGIPLPLRHPKRRTR